MLVDVWSGREAWNKMGNEDQGSEVLQTRAQSTYRYLAACTDRTTWFQMVGSCPDYHDIIQEDSEMR